jgi:hypothetical protein
MKKPRENVFQRLRAPANLNYLVLTAAGLLVYFLVMSQSGNDTGALLAILIAVPGVLARWVLAPVLVLAVTTYLRIDPGFMGAVGYLSGSRWFINRTPSGFNLEDAILAAALLAYVIGHYRLTSLVHQGMPEDRGFRGDREAPKPPMRPPDTAPPDELPKVLFVGAGCVVVGQVAWLILSTIERAQRPHPFAAGTARLLLLIWVVGGGLMLAAAALVYLRAARMSPREAALTLRDAHFHETRRETDRLHRWRHWFKEKVAARRRAGK